MIPHLWDHLGWLYSLTSIQIPVLNTAAYWRGCVKTAPSLPHWFWPPGLIHLPTVRAVPGLSSCTDQDGKPPTFLDTGLAWSRAAPGARRKPSGQLILTKSDRYICPVLCHVVFTQSSASVGSSQNLQRNLHVAPCVISLRKRPPKLHKRNDTNQRHQKRFSQNLIIGNFS